jgi:Cft2 family RNA processing exonuclease
MNQKKPTLTFCSGVGTVTGADFLLDIANKKILIDCGLEQGSSFAEERNRDPFPFTPSDIDFLFVTHAHADHIGRIPKLVKDGFKGIIYSTPATHDLSQVMLPDTLKLIQDEAHRSGTLPLYEAKNVSDAFRLWKTISYYEKFNVTQGLDVSLKDSGHIFGSTMYEFSYGIIKRLFLRVTLAIRHHCFCVTLIQSPMPPIFSWNRSMVTAITNQKNSASMNFTILFAIRLLESARL